MAKVKNLIGLKFGRLTVLNQSSQRGNNNQVKWDCVCDCGNRHTVQGDSLNGGKSKSCGCLLRDARYVKNKNTDREKAMLLLLYNPLKKDIRQKFNLEKIIDFDTFKKLSLSNCFYCNSKPLNTKPDVRYETRNGKKEKLIITNYILRYNGIDRIDSYKGYVNGNVVPCCKNAIQLKCN